MGNLQKSSFLVHYLKAENKFWFTFALITVVVTGYVLLLEKILNHCQYLSIIILIEIECKVPSVIKCNGLIGAFWANNSRKKLSCKKICNNRVFSLFIVLPPFFTLFKNIFTICYRLCFVISAVSSLYFGLEERFSYWLISYRRAVRNYCASCWA